MWDPFAEFQSAVLTNGLTVHVLQWPERPGMRFEFGIHSGGRHDLHGKEGTAHYMEHLVCENGEVPYDELKEFFDTNSGYQPSLGSTSFYSTTYGFHSSADVDLLSTSLRYFGHMLLHTSLINFVERERHVIAGEFNRRFPTEYEYKLARREHLSVFPNTFFARMPRPLGTLETIKSMTQADLQQFYDTHYTPANMSVVAVGELSLGQVIAFLENSPFGLPKPGTRSPRLELLTETPCPTERLELFDEGKYKQGKTVAQYSSVAQLPGTVGLSELSIFSSMLEKELFRVVRQQRAWAYSVGCGGGSFGDFHSFNIGSDGLKLEAIDEIEEVVSNCIASLPDQVSLFERSQKANIARKRFGDPDVKSITSAAMSDIFRENRIISLAEEIEESEAISMDNICSLVERLSPERRRTCIRHP